MRILNNEQPEFSIIFTKTKRHATEVCRKLNKERGINFRFAAGFIHGDVTQAKREETIEKFRNKELNCLVATNVLARGMDFPKVSHVFNYDLPRDPEDYIHRIGRTARVAGVEKKVTAGKAISIISTSQKELMDEIEQLLKYKIERREVPEAVYGTPTPRKEFIFEEEVRNAHSRSPNSNNRQQSSNKKQRDHSPKKRFGNSKSNSKNNSPRTVPARHSHSDRAPTPFNTRIKKIPKIPTGSTDFSGSSAPAEPKPNHSKTTSLPKRRNNGPKRDLTTPPSTQKSISGKIHIDRRSPYYINKLTEAKKGGSSKSGKKKTYSGPKRQQVSSSAK
ncbi:MAG: DEAD/DEAH box helicase [Promethearchaeota archaeon]|nr:MAG: DEAD/DEAH box helicase [Candidatus Lokiarchaeota archaeon]